MKHTHFWAIALMVLVLSMALTPSALAEVKRDVPSDANGGHATVSGVVYQDWDQDGVWDEQEPMLAGAVVQLHALRGDLLGEIITGNDGAFRFEHLTPGAYILTEKDPLGFSSLDNNKITLVVEAGDWVEAAFGDMLLLMGGAPSSLGRSGEVVVIERALR